MFSNFITPSRAYTLRVDKFVCNKFGIAEFFARSMAATSASCKKVLDVGCGAGPLMILLADQYGAKAIGVEVNAEACRCCRENLRQYGLSDTTRVFEGEFSTFGEVNEEDGFDLIVSNPPLNKNVTADEISRYKQRGYSRLDSEAFSYVTNSWHDESGKDLLDLIFEYSVGHLSHVGKIAIAFCEIDGADLEFVVSKGARHGFKPVCSVCGSITPASIGAEKIATADIAAHYVVFERCCLHAD